MKKASQKEIIQRFKKIHGDKYDYSLVEYINQNTKVKIICKKHGVFEQKPVKHINNQGCPLCSHRSYKYTLKEFIEKANQVHNNKYSYPQQEYKNKDSKIKIICPEHGLFEQTPHNHIQGKNCPKCSNRDISYDERVDIFNKIHNNKYSYPYFNTTKVNDIIKIICPVHGVFETKIRYHQTGRGCRKCGITASSKKQYLGVPSFIKRAKEIHGDKYDYKLVNYINVDSKVKIICPDHGVFEQVAGDHLYNKSGCPTCKESKGEREVRKLLTERSINFITQYKFKDCKDKKPLPFDFYLPELNTCIEYQGIQHYEVRDSYFGSKNFNIKEIQRRDQIKRDYCKENNITLLEIRFDENIEEKLNLLSFS